MRMLKKRGRLSEPEVRYMLAQLSRALVYLKEQRVIHRDLKLGNLMLDSALNVKVGTYAGSNRPRRPLAALNQPLIVIRIHVGHRRFWPCCSIG